MASLRGALGRVAVGWSRGSQTGKERLLGVAAAALGPRLAAALAAARVDDSGIDRGRRTVLTLTRPHFNDDIDELRRRARLNWPTLNLPFLGFVQAGWAAPAMRRQVDYQTTRDAAHAAAWRTIERFGEHLLDRLSARWPIDAVLSSNIDYWQAEGLRVAAQRRGIPFLALSRENVITTYDERLVRDIYRPFRFEGDAVAVFSPRMRNVLIDSGACAPDQVVVTGSLRLDHWRSLAATKRRRDSILLVSFANPGYYAPLAFRACLDVFLAAARDHARSGVRFVIKAKNPEDRRAVLEAAGGVPESVTIIDRVPLSELLPVARLAIGFNSMALYEAMFTDVPVAVPRWLDSDRHPDELAFDPGEDICRRALHYFDSAAGLRAAIDVAAAGGQVAAPDPGDRMALIRRFAHVSDRESAAELVERFVLDRLRGPARAAA